jgi:hypothetical protein
MHNEELSNIVLPPGESIARKWLKVRNGSGCQLALEILEDIYGNVTINLVKEPRGVGWEMQANDRKRKRYYYYGQVELKAKSLASGKRKKNKES